MRLIDADALELILSNAIVMIKTMAKALGSEDDPEIQMEIKAYTDILNGVKEQPTIEPERKTEHWIIHKDWLDEGECGYECPKCGRCYDYAMNFCGFCGTKIEVEYDK